MSRAEQNSALVWLGFVIVMSSAFLRITLIQTPWMLIPAFIGLAIAWVGAIRRG